ncbi:hypothetical protein TMatcc_002486 [Talaromyces marneffei ATCC 18224]|uniref:uncharacterized protein n=1 Tax=Talaromyces marneffei TaxID=37727 RepID=UPI0012AA298F|nr:uncharacterized protein EYB26_006372 [Talaromyces marneffei]KAE8552440.1 hypothetical protein EYB25_006334 [Talaromyces marneffei]QGA18687.1 hypothetical protein EYB26_006372 [Talaromyces marneffei]
MLGERGGIEAAAHRALERQRREGEEAAARDEKKSRTTQYLTLGRRWFLRSSQVEDETVTTQNEGKWKRFKKHFQ